MLYWKPLALSVHVLLFEMANSLLQPKKKLYGCDTFVAFPPATPAGVIVFGKNSDRPEGEGQSIRRYPRTTHFETATGNGEDTTSNNQQQVQVQCTYIQIPQVPTTHAVLLSQIDWMWGAEIGANEHGVVIGNEAVWTQEPCHGHVKRLLGMDLVRLGLERGSTAKEALDVITSLLEEHGQSGPCAENDPSFTYHNSYMIVDPKEAWVLETAGRQWVAERITSGVRNISNCLSIRTNYDLASKGIEEHAIEKGYWKKNDLKKPFDFTEAFCTGSVSEETSDPRFCGGRRLLEQHSEKGSMNKDAMIAILRDHSSGICMHGGFETTASWVSEIAMTRLGTEDPTPPARHWLTGKAHPCQSAFEEQEVVASSN